MLLRYVKFQCFVAVMKSLIFACLLVNIPMFELILWVWGDPSNQLTYPNLRYDHSNIHTRPFLSKPCDLECLSIHKMPN